MRFRRDLVEILKHFHAKFITINKLIELFTQDKNLHKLGEHLERSMPTTRNGEDLMIKKQIIHHSRIAVITTMQRFAHTGYVEEKTVDKSNKSDKDLMFVDLNELKKGTKAYKITDAGIEWLLFKKH